MMKRETFLENLKIQFEETDANKLNMDTEFQSLDTWDSLTQFSIVDFLEDDFSIEFDAKLFTDYNTPDRLYAHVEQLVG
mgnify:FL=1